MYVDANFSELPVEFTKPLEDTKAYVKGDATLTCELNRPNKKVKWTKNGKQVRGNRDCKVKADGVTHQLVFTDLADNEAGKYVCTCGDASTSCTFTVEGWC